jgi:hypothetical protein
MVFLEKRKTRILDAIQRRLQNASLALQLDSREHRFTLEEAVLVKVQERLNQKGSTLDIQKNMIEMAELDTDAESDVSQAVEEIACSETGV